MKDKLKGQLKMATNADTETEVEETEVSKDAQASEDAVADLAAAKAEAKDKPEATETAQETNSETAEAEESKESEATLTKEVPVEPEKDLDWYKKAYSESTAEGLRQKARADELEAKQTPPPEAPAPESDEVLTPEQLYIRQKQNEEIVDAFSEISAKYPSLKERATYDKFVAEANTIGRVIVESEKRFPSPKELYSKAAVILGLTPDNSEELGAAVKAGAETTKTSSGTPSIPQKSKVTEEMIAANLKMYPSKTRQEIIEELEPHIQ